MKIGCYGKTSNQVMSAIHEGAEAIGLAPFFRNPSAFKSDQTEKFDVVFCLGLAGTGRRVFDAYRAINMPVILVDCGYIFRDQGYNQLSLNGLNSLPVSAAHDRASEMGLIAQNKRRGSYILVCGQLPGDNQHNINVAEWRKDVESRLADITDIPVYFRPHPRVERPSVPFAEALADCHCMVTHNSTAAYEAIMAGVPVICDPCAVYSEVCETDLRRVKTPRLGAKAKRQKLLDRVAYGQWTLEEMRTGKALEFVLEGMDA